MRTLHPNPNGESETTVKTLSSLQTLELMLSNLLVYLNGKVLSLNAIDRLGISRCLIGSPTPGMKRTHPGCLLWSVGYASVAYLEPFQGAATSACNSGFASKIWNQGIPKA